MPKFAVGCNGRLIDRPFLTRKQAQEEMDVLMDETPQTPTVGLFVLVPISEWDEMREWIENLRLTVLGYGISTNH